MTDQLRPEDEIGVAIGGSIHDQQYRYRGKTWNAEDIYRVMTAAETGEKEPPNYIVARVNGDHYVLSLRQNGIYDTKGNFGDMVRDARQIADILNQHAGKDG